MHFEPAVSAHACRLFLCSTMISCKPRDPKGCKLGHTMNLIAGSIRRITEVEHLQAIRDLLTNINAAERSSHYPVLGAITTLGTHAFYHWRSVCYVGEKMTRLNKVACCSVTGQRIMSLCQTEQPVEAATVRLHRAETSASLPSTS